MFQSRPKTIQCWTRRAARAVIAALAAWSALALGDDLLARKVHLDIPAQPLASALVQLSTQAGVQVAAAGQDVAHVQAAGVKGGDYPLGDALNLLLQGTGLSFGLADNGSIAIRAAATVAGQSDVNVINPGPLPPAEALAGSSLSEFIRHHGTTYTLDTDPSGPARWRGARAETICPVTLGLDPAYNAFVSARIRAVAAYVGAPVATTDSRCEPNVEVVFTSEPRKPLEQALTMGARNRIDTNVLRPFSETLDLSEQHAVQGLWRVVGNLAIINDDAKVIPGGQLRGLWQRVIPTTSMGGAPTQGLRTPYAGPSILNLLLVINTQKLGGAHMGTIADYLAFVTLSIAQNPDHCDSLPSILDQMAASCSQRPAPTTLTAADVAFLKAVYSQRPSISATRSMGEIETLMRQQLTEQQ